MKINFALILFSNIDRKWNILETYHPSDIMFQGIFETLVNYKVFGSSTGISMEKFQVSEWERVSKFSMSQSLYRGGKLGIFLSFMDIFANLTLSGGGAVTPLCVVQFSIVCVVLVYRET